MRTRTNPRTPKKKTPYGPNIVRAWFDTVFRYAFRGLDSEREFLARHNWTFRFRPPSLEYIAPLRAHVPVRDNLDQFLSFFEEVKFLVTEHDERVAKLFDECLGFHTALVASPRLRETYRAIAGEAPSTLGKNIDAFFGAYSDEEDFIAILAEYLVNNAGELPRHYTTADLWNRYRTGLTAILDEEPLSAHRKRTAEAGAKLLRAVQDLHGQLHQTRSELSLRFDVPYVADVAGVR